MVLLLVKQSTRSKEILQTNKNIQYAYSNMFNVPFNVQTDGRGGCLTRGGGCLQKIFVKIQFDQKLQKLPLCIYYTSELASQVICVTNLVP